MEIPLFCAVALTLGAGITAQWVAWRFHLPAIVLLFSLGLLFGPGLQILNPSASLGALFRPIISLAVAVIVFEGGLLLDFRQLREAGQGIGRLTFVALPISWVVGSLAAHLIGNLEWGVAALFGAIITVTGPTVVLPLLRYNKLQPRVAAYLRWEAIINDPIGAILAAVVLQVAATRVPIGTEIFLTTVLPDLLASAAESLAIGIVPAYLVRYLFVRDMMPETLKTPLLLTLALMIFSVCNMTMGGAGLIGATVFGITLTNLRVPGLSELRRVKESLVVLVVAVLFILLTADLQRDVLARLSVPLCLLTAAVMFVVRPLSIYLATIGTALKWQERLFVAWIAPRGIVAAAVAGAAGYRMTDAGYQSGDLVMPAVFAIIGGTMVFHGFSLRPLARVLGLTLSNEPALAIVGASAWSIDFARCLTSAGIPVLLVDNRSSSLLPAMRLGVSVMRAELLSQHGEEELEERPADYLIATSPDAIYNGLVCAHMAPHIGRQRVFQISPGIAQLDFYHGLSRDARGKLFGDASWNFTLIQQLFEKGWRFVATHGNEELIDSYGSVTDRLDLLSVRRGQSLSIRSAEDTFAAKPAVGDLIISMVDAKRMSSTRPDDGFQPPQGRQSKPVIPASNNFLIEVSGMAMQPAVPPFSGGR